MPYRIGDWRDLPGDGWSPTSGFVDLYAGGRYMSLNVGLDLQLPNRAPDGTLKSVINISGSGRKSWIDPIFGVRTRWNFSEKWNIGFEGDIGGGANADLTWQMMALAGRRFDLLSKNDANFIIGYRAVYEKYQDGQGDRLFAFDAVTHGPVLGVGIKF